MDLFEACELGEDYKYMGTCTNAASSGGDAMVAEKAAQECMLSWLTTPRPLLSQLLSHEMRQACRAYFVCHLAPATSSWQLVYN